MAAVALDRISACIVAGRRTVVQSAVSLRMGLSSCPFHHFPLDFSKSILTDIYLAVVQGHGEALIVGKLT